MNKKSIITALLALVAIVSLGATSPSANKGDLSIIDFIFGN